MMLISPQTTVEDVDRHNQVFRECIGELVG